MSQEIKNQIRSLLDQQNILDKRIDNIIQQLLKRKIIEQSKIANKILELQKQCQHKDDSGFMFGLCVYCGEFLG